MATYPMRTSGLVGSFTQSILAHNRKAMARVNDKCYEIARELFSSIVRLTPSPSSPGPQADGLLVNNWFPMDGVTFSQDKTDTESNNGAGSLGRIRSLKGRQFFLKDGAVTLANNLHYAYRAEVLGWPKKDGWSGSSSGRYDGRIDGGPYRMVARSLQAVAAKYKK